ncbi:hypothetical protein KDD17_11580 [Sulfitobacter albidus]|uniref:Uncharacterized protein n=1 Tax=Sulfitobacter albidus TaxID=2829501 RepID=A0A975JC80_9RHOB|nr:hypothetical protein [Sulfitobacter albidus]QUJ75596.1 hypothetical protein KDD17_11580 [Sulfitobacter albidus]
MTQIEMKRGEHGVIRVFAISRPIAEVAKALREGDRAELGTALLNHPVTDRDIEIFPLSDLGTLGLANYLSEGYDISREDLRRDRARLEALDGYVLLLHARVAAQEAVTLRPDPDLTLIATYGEPRADMTAAPFPSEAAAPYSGATAPSEPARRAPLVRAGVVLIVALCLLLLWWSLS